jgi:hypothetical protein
VLLQSESSEVFFSVTKLFQHKDVHLRRMVYLVIKEVIPSSDEVIIITSSLMKDMNSRNDLYRANAIRVLCRIIDPQMLLQIERYLKQAVVDKSAVVASAVLAGAIHLAGANAEVIKRWSNEVQEAINSRHPMVQFQAVALMHALRATDRLAVSKLVSQLTRGNVRSPMAQCLLVRYVAQVRPGPGAGFVRPCCLPAAGRLLGCRSSQAPMHDPPPWLAGTRSEARGPCPAPPALAGDCGEPAGGGHRAAPLLRLPGGLPAAQERGGHL